MQTAPGTEFLQAEISAKNKTIEEYRVRVEQLLAENNTLKETLSQKERDTFEVISFLRVENDDLKVQLSNFETVVENTKEQIRLETQRVNAERDARIREMQLQFNNREMSRAEEIVILQRDLDQLKEFRERRDILEQELDHVRQEMSDMQSAHRNAFSQLERKLFEEKQRLQKEAQEQVEAIKKHSEEEVVSRLDVSTKRILQQNRRLAEDLRLHVAETESLSKKNAKLEEDNQALKRNLQLNEQSVQEFAKHSYRQSKEIKELTAKVKNLEKSLTQIVRDFEKERDRVIAKNKAESDDLAVENTGLRKVLQVKDKEHKRIKRLAQEILNQRTEVEQFFLEALDQVKEEIRQRRVMASANNMDSVFLTQDGYGNNNKNNGTRLPTIDNANDQRVDIRDLNWEDKERVLRLLFAKINKANLPAPSSSQHMSATAPPPPPSGLVPNPPSSGFANSWGGGGGGGRKSETPTRMEELRRTQMTPESTSSYGVGERRRPPLE